MPSRRKTGGGIGYTHGLSVNEIESFLPSLIPDIALWIKAESKFIKEETVHSYANKQSYFIKEAVMTQFKDSLKSKVITEIVSDTPATPNSLVPLNLDSNLATVFPTLRIINNELDAINISNYKEPITGKAHRLQLITAKPVSIDGSASSYTISHGFTVSQNSITGQIILTPEYIEEPVVDVQAKPSDPVTIHPNNTLYAADIEPTAEISELIIYSRVLTPDENMKLEGYLAFKQNTQYALPATHPYLPNMMSDPIFAPIAQQMKASDDTLRQTLENMTVAINDYVNEKGQTGHVLDAPRFQQAIQTCIQNHANIIPSLSKGYLYARKINSLTLDTIYKVIHDKIWSRTPITANSMSQMAIDASGAITNANNFIKSLLQTYSQPFVQQGGADPELSSSQVQVSDHVLFTQQSEASNALYQQLRTNLATTRLNGSNAYNVLQNQLKSDIAPMIDSVLHQWSDIQTKHNLLTSTFEPVQTSILNGKWLTYLPNIDKANTPILKNSIQVSTKYNDPALDLIQTYYNYVSLQMKQGDYAYILQEFKMLRDLFTSFSEEPLNPVFRATYMNYLSNFVKRAENYYKEFITIHTEFTKYLENINSFITVAQETGQTSTFPERVDETSKYKSMPLDIYVRRVLNLDTTLFGLEYVETDANGLILETKVIPFYPRFLNYIFMNSVYNKQTPYVNDDGTPIKQTYHMLVPFSESVYRGLTDAQKPVLYTKSLNSLTEISRNEINAIHCFEPQGSIAPILLPTNAVANNSWFLVYNIGQNPIVVRTSESSCETIGSNNGILYIYDAANETYASHLWCKEQLPYDTLLNCPRTSLSMYIDELGTSVYIRTREADSYEPVYTPDGYLVEVVKADDGSVYDIDDVYKSNPYKVSSVSVDNRVKLILNPTMKKMVKISSNLINVSQDIRTGFGILLGTNGAVGVNEFGFVKAIRTPIQQIGNTYKIRGSYGDIIVNLTSTGFLAPYDFEPFLTFESVFRTRFVSPVESNYIFVTNSLNPIVNPSGIIIQVPPINGTGPMWYTDLSGQHEITVVNSSSNLQSGISTYDKPAIHNNSHYERLKIRYMNSKEYIQSEIKYMTICQKEIEPFGQDAVALCTEAAAEFQTFLSSLQQNDNIFESNSTLTLLAVNNTLASIKTTMDAFFVKQQDVSKNIEAYRKGISEIKSVKDSVNYWNNDGSKAMDSMVLDINTNIQNFLNTNGTTSATSLEELLKSSLDAQTQFNGTLKTCVNYILTPPTFISEVYSWYSFIQPNLAQLKSLYDDVIEIRSIELPRIIKSYNKTQQYAVTASKIQSLFADTQNKWTQILSQKTALDTYLQLHQGTLSPEQIASKQAKITDYDNRIMQGDIKFNALYKQIKTQPPTEQLYTLVKEFQSQITDLQTAMNSI
jgi:hypothetical protein